MMTVCDEVICAVNWYSYWYSSSGFAWCALVKPVGFFV